MNVYFVEKFSEGQADEQLNAMRAAGFHFTSLQEADLIYCASIVMMERAMSAARTRPLPLAVYCWDYYAWSHGQKNTSGDWVRYAEFLRMADIIFVPSAGQQRRLKELLDLDSHVVLSGIRTYDYTTVDGGYVLDPLRHYPEANKTWAEDAASELGIKLIHTEHQYSEADFRTLVAGCRFLVCAVREASTGGLTLAEGLWLGKPSLISNSPYMGGADYVGEFARTFQYDDFEDLKRVMREMWEHPHSIDKAAAREFMQSNLTFEVMAKKLYNLCQASTLQRRGK